MAQRLVRKICPKCRTEFEPTRDKLPRDFDLPGADALLRAGLPELPQFGLPRRAGLYELLVMSDEIPQRSWSARPSRNRGCRPPHGLRLLREDGWHEGAPRRHDHRRSAEVHGVVRETNANPVRW